MLAVLVITHSKQGVPWFTVGLHLVMMHAVEDDIVRNRRGEFVARGARCPRHCATSYFLLIKYLRRKRGLGAEGTTSSP